MVPRHYLRWAWGCTALLGAGLAAVAADGWQAPPAPPSQSAPPAIVPPLAPITPVTAQAPPASGPLGRPIEGPPPAVPRRPIESPLEEPPLPSSLSLPDVFQSYVGPPPGFTGPSGIA